MKNMIVLIMIISIGFTQHIDCVGNSITNNGFPTVADQLMKDNGIGFNVQEYGVPGSGVVQNAYKDTPEYTEVLCRGAQYIVMMLGTNDIGWYINANQDGKDKFKREYEYLVKAFKANSIVIIGTTTLRADGATNQAQINATINEMNGVIRGIANSYGLQIINFTDALGTNPINFWNDKLHPNADGTRLLGTELFNQTKNLYIGSNGLNNCEPEKVNEMAFNWEQIEDKIHFTWNSVEGATSYKLLKSHLVDGDWTHWWDSDIKTTEYFDSDFIYDWDYFCGVKAYKNNTLIGESPVSMVRYYQYLSIEDEYWDAVEDYENQKPGLLNSCSLRSR